MLRIVNRDGVCHCCNDNDKAEAEERCQQEAASMRSGKIIGIGLDEMTEAGVIRPIEAIYPSREEEAEVFIEKIRLSRRNSQA